MTYKIEVKYNDIYKALEVLEGIRLWGAIQGPPTTRIPLRKIVEKTMANNIIGREEYRGIAVVGVKVEEQLYLACHFKDEGEDDFCVIVEGENAWSRILKAAERIYKITKESYTLTLSIVLHAIQGLITGEEGEIEEISSADQIIEELLTWLPEYIVVTD
ncbi:MAG: hypothetical protein ABWW69_04740 [Pyrodictiaceae archaeon]